MSIDSDLRSGIVSKDEAKQKRRDLEMEAKLHGSMDGAMKFVKGDAIAGIVIIIVNLLGGLTIGVLQLDMNLSAAMSKYSILTVGDGMVAQIPAILGALSAGLIVTRVTDATSNSHLGDSIQQQISNVPRASLVAGGACFLFAIIPGFPSKTFVFIGILLCFAGLMVIPEWKSRIRKVSDSTIESLFPQNEIIAPQITNLKSNPPPPTVPLLLQFSNANCNQAFIQKLVAEIACIQKDIHQELGVQLPTINFHWNQLVTSGWSLLANEVPIASGNSNDSNGLENIASKVEIALRRNAKQFIGIQETVNLVHQTSINYPDIAREIQRILPMQNLAGILRNLVSESTSIRNIKIILEAIIEVGQSEKDINHLTEYVRCALSQQISYKVAPLGSMRVLTLEPTFEEFISNRVRKGAGRNQLSINPKDAELLMMTLEHSIDQTAPDAILTNVQIRKSIRMLIENSRFDTPVLSYNEIATFIKLEVLGKVELPNQNLLESA